MQKKTPNVKKNPVAGAKSKQELESQFEAGTKDQERHAKAKGLSAAYVKGGR